MNYFSSIQHPGILLHAFASHSFCSCFQRFHYLLSKVPPGWANFHSLKYEIRLTALFTKQSQ